MLVVMTKPLLYKCCSISSYLAELEVFEGQHEVDVDSNQVNYVHAVGMTSSCTRTRLLMAVNYQQVLIQEIHQMIVT